MSERDRILAVPSWAPPDPPPDLTDVFRRPGGTMRAWPVQSAIWYTAWRLRREYPDRPYGMLVSAGVGQGKTLASYLLPLAAGLRRPLLLVPSKLEAKTHLDFSVLRPHWKDPPPITVLTYEALSSPRASSLLETLRPDGIIADECHRLKSSSAARTRRVLRYWRAHPEVRWYLMSGTLVDSEIQDVVHLAEMALREHSPAPRNGPGFAEVMAWAQVLNVSGTPGPSDYGFFRRIHDAWAPDRRAWEAGFESRRASCRAAYARRFAATPGAVLTRDQGFGGGLVITERTPAVPTKVREVLEEVRDTWALPDGTTVFTNPLEISRALCQLSCGFYYRWAWERLGLRGPDEEWMRARRAWGSAVRGWLTGTKIPPVGLDSEALIAAACRDGDPRITEELREAWVEWEPVKSRWAVDYDRRGGPRKIPVEAVWISEFLLDDAEAWAEEQKEPVILWYDYRALEQRLRKRKGIEVYGRDREPPQGPGQKVARVSALSVIAHGEGKNLQSWGNQLFLRAFSSGKIWEQALGRTHRPGQPRDEVQAAVNVHTRPLRDALASAREKATFIEAVNEAPQKLCAATWLKE